MRDNSNRQANPAGWEDPCWKESDQTERAVGDTSSKGFPQMPASQHPEENMAWLVKTIEAEIIPRLMAAHQNGAALDFNSPSGSVMIQGSDIADFADVTLKNEAAVCEKYVRGLLGRGISLEKIYLELMAPAARRLGEMWTADLCDFTQVTIGLWRMQQLMYDLSPSFRDQARNWGGHRRNVMLMTAPGSQHTLGILMVAEFFRRAGWTVWGEPAAERDRLYQAVQEEWFDIAGISVHTPRQMDQLADFIIGLRKASRNGAICVMVGGPVFIEHPEYAEQVGADAVSTDAADAIQQAEGLVAMREQHTSRGHKSQMSS